jgi:TatD DNase family protein
VGLNFQAGLVDTHCHLNFDEFDPDRDEVVDRARENGISRILIPGIDIETSESAIKYASEYPEVYAAVGVHPNSAINWTTNTLDKIKKLAASQKVVAIGEIGLDYYRDQTPREIQMIAFEQQLELAAELELPVIIHNREASEDIHDIIQDWHYKIKANRSKLTEKPGEMHAFTGDAVFAKLMISLNFTLGITGPLTFRNSHLLQSLVSEIPLERLFIETDSPFLTPHPFRGKRNEPANVRIVAEKIAELKAVPVKNVIEVTTASADFLFNWREIH